MKFNHMEEPSLIYAGRYLFIPGAERPIEITKKHQTISPKYKAGTYPFIWPVKGKVISFFGFHGGRRRNGIEIACPRFSHVKASEKGVVASAGVLRGYGNIIIIDHYNGYYTIYAHNERNLSSRGEKVEKGQQIALAGSTGRTDQPCLYFEIRQGSRAVDPLAYLPQ